MKRKRIILEPKRPTNNKSVTAITILPTVPEAKTIVPTLPSTAPPPLPSETAKAIAPIVSKPSTTPKTKVKKEPKKAVEPLIEELKLYYEKYFPAAAVYAWLKSAVCYLNDFPDEYNPYNGQLMLTDTEEEEKKKRENSDPTDYEREFSLYITSTQGKPVMLRFLYMSDAGAWKRAIAASTNLFKGDRLSKIDIGAIYSPGALSHINLGSKRDTLGRELVFDIDLTDYDDVRRTTCGCQERELCSACWSLVRTAIRCTNAALADSFGYHDVQWFYTGGRGVHGWVRDPKAMRLTSAERTAMLRYLRLPFWNSVIHRKENKSTTMTENIPKLKESSMYNVGPEVVNVLNAFWDAMYKLCLPEFVRTYVHHLDVMHREPFLRQHKLKTTVWDKLPFYIQRRLVMFHMYPRMDFNVSAHMDHLLRCPFSVHPSTNRLCVPIPKGKEMSFVPWFSPTIYNVLDGNYLPAVL